MSYCYRGKLMLLASLKSTSRFHPVPGWRLQRLPVAFITTSNTYKDVCPNSSDNPERPVLQTCLSLEKIKQALSFKDALQIIQSHVKAMTTEEATYCLRQMHFLQKNKMIKMSNNRFLNTAEFQGLENILLTNVTNLQGHTAADILLLLLKFQVPVDNQLVLHLTENIMNNIDSLPCHSVMCLMLELKMRRHSLWNTLRQALHPCFENQIASSPDVFSPEEVLLAAQVMDKYKLSEDSQKIIEEEFSRLQDTVIKSDSVQSEKLITPLTKDLAHPRFLQLLERSANSLMKSREQWTLQTLQTAVNNLLCIGNVCQWSPSGDLIKAVAGFYVSNHCSVEEGKKLLNFCRNNVQSDQFLEAEKILCQYFEKIRESNFPESQEGLPSSQRESPFQIISPNPENNCRDSERMESRANVEEEDESLSQIISRLVKRKPYVSNIPSQRVQENQERQVSSQGKDDFSSRRTLENKESEEGDFPTRMAPREQKELFRNQNEDGSPFRIISANEDRHLGNQDEIDTSLDSVFTKRETSQVEVDASVRVVLPEERENFFKSQDEDSPFRIISSNQFEISKKQNENDIPFRGISEIREGSLKNHEDEGGSPFCVPRGQRDNDFRRTSTNEGNGGNPFQRIYHEGDSLFPVTPVKQNEKFSRREVESHSSAYSMISAIEDEEDSSFWSDPKFRERQLNKQIQDDSSSRLFNREEKPKNGGSRNEYVSPFQTISETESERTEVFGDRKNTRFQMVHNRNRQNNDDGDFRSEMIRKSEGGSLNRNKISLNTEKRNIESCDEDESAFKIIDDCEALEFEGDLYEHSHENNVQSKAELAVRRLESFTPRVQSGKRFRSLDNCIEQLLEHKDEWSLELLQRAVKALLNIKEKCSWSPSGQFTDAVAQFYASNECCIENRFQMMELYNNKARSRVGHAEGWRIAEISEPKNEIRSKLDLKNPNEMDSIIRMVSYRDLPEYRMNSIVDAVLDSLEKTGTKLNEFVAWKVLVLVGKCTGSLNCLKLAEYAVEALIENQEKWTLLLLQNIMKTLVFIKSRRDWLPNERFLECAAQFLMAHECSFELAHLMTKLMKKDEPGVEQMAFMMYLKDRIKSGFNERDPSEVISAYSIAVIHRFPPEHRKIIMNALLEMKLNSVKLKSNHISNLLYMTCESITLFQDQMAFESVMDYVIDELMDQRAEWTFGKINKTMKTVFYIACRNAWSPGRDFLDNVVQFFISNGASLSDALDVTWMDKKSVGLSPVAEHLIKRMLEDEKQVSFTVLCSLVRILNVKDFQRIENWTSVKEMMKRRCAVFDYSSVKRSDLLFTAYYLSGMNIFDHEMLGTIFQPKCFEEYSSFPKGTEVLLELYSNVKTWDDLKLPDLPESVIRKCALERRNRRLYSKFFQSIRGALEVGLGDSSFVKAHCSTKIGLFADLLVIFGRDGSPIAFTTENQLNECFIEDLPKPEDARLVIIQSCSGGSKGFTGVSAMMLKTLQAQGYDVVGLNRVMWEEMPTGERIPYLMNLINTSCASV